MNDLEKFKNILHILRLDYHTEINTCHGSKRIVIPSDSGRYPEFYFAEFYFDVTNDFLFYEISDFSVDLYWVSVIQSNY